MTPDSGPDNRLPEQMPRPKRFFFLLALLVIVASTMLYAAGNVVRERPIEDTPGDAEAILQGIQDGGDGFPTGRSLGEKWTPRRQMPAIQYCYDSASDCGTFATNYCQTRGGVQLNVYSSGAEIPCQVTCINGEGAQCSEPPPNTAPAPKKPGDVTGLQQRVGRTAR